jgi:hypothetical protein
MKTCAWPATRLSDVASVRPSRPRGLPRTRLVGNPVNKEGPETLIDVRIPALKLHLASTRMVRALSKRIGGNKA